MTTLSGNYQDVFTPFTLVRNWWSRRKAWQRFHDHVLSNHELHHRSRIDRLNQRGTP